MSLSIVNLDTRIKDIVNTKILLDTFGKERITGTKDWSWRIDIYRFDITSSALDIINDNTLTNVLNNINYIPFITQYHHLLEYSPETDLTQYLINLNLDRTNYVYLVHLNTNILLKEELYFSVTARSSYLSNYLNYYINFNLQTIDPKTQAKRTAAASHKNYFLFNKGWNRFDFFSFVDSNISVKTSLQINFLYNLLLVNPSADDVYDIFFQNFIIKNEKTLQNINVYSDFTNKIEMISGFFSDTSKLFPAFTKDAQQLLITNNTNAPNSDFSIQQGSIKYLSTIKSQSLSYTWTNSTNNTIQKFKPIDIIDRLFYVDYISIQNNSTTNSLSNVTFQLKINNTDINQSSFLIPQNILPTDSFHYKNIYYPITSNLDILPVLTTSNTTQNYSILISILEEKSIQADVCPLQFQNLIINNTTYSKNTLTIMDDGSVGIGTDSTNSFSLYVNDINRNKKGIFCADDITFLSDRRFKKNILPIQNALDKVCKLQGVTYQKLNSNNQEYGLIAQDVQKILPECVQTIDKDGHLGIEYNKLISLLIEAIKELKNK